MRWMRQSGGPLIALIMGVGCDTPQAPTWCLPRFDDVEVVSSTDRGAWSVEGKAPRLVEIRRSGGSREHEEFAYPIGGAASTSGLIAIPEFSLGEVVVVDSHGAWLGSWTQNGKGPGETLLPAAVAWGDTETVTVFDLEGSKIVFRSRTGRAAEDIAVARSFVVPIVASGQVDWVGVDAAGDVFIDPGIQPNTTYAGGFSSVILRLRVGASIPDAIAVAPARVVAEGRYADWAVPGWPRVRAAVAADGHYAIGGEDNTYRIVVYDRSGTPRLQVCREDSAFPLDPEERLLNATSPQEKELEAAIRSEEQPASPASFGRLFFDASGRLWVQRERSSPGGRSVALLARPGAHYDVFDVDGRYLGEINAPPGMELIAGAGETIWAFEAGPLDEVWLVTLRLTFD